MNIVLGNTADEIVDAIRFAMQDYQDGTLYANLWEIRTLLKYKIGSGQPLFPYTESGPAFMGVILLKLDNTLPNGMLKIEVAV